MRASRGISSRAWSRIRRLALDRDSWRCRECEAASRLEVHHVKRAADGGGDELTNLLTLCRGCHIDRHRRRSNAAQGRKWQDMVDELFRK